MPIFSIMDFVNFLNFIKEFTNIGVSGDALYKHLFSKRIRVFIVTIMDVTPFKLDIDELVDEFTQVYLLEFNFFICLYMQ